MGKILVKGYCNYCGREQEVNLDKEGVDMYKRGVNIQEALPAANMFEREFLLSGFCFKCQSRIFGHPAPGQEEEYGEHLGDCDCCGYPLYEHKIGKGKAKACPHCKEPVSEGVLICLRKRE